jgi:hypothetical protein
LLEVANLEEGRRAVDENLFYDIDIIKVTLDDDGVGINTANMSARPAFFCANATVSRV